LAGLVRPRNTREELTRATREKSQDQRARGFATIMVNMDTSLHNAHMKEEVRMKTRRRRRTRLTPRTRRTRNILRRSPMMKLTLDKSVTPMMRVHPRIVKTWQL
jgi:hypothetical protein